MNERIRELAEQAWKEILDETNIDGDISTMFSADEVVTFEQKFAELIVRECIECADIVGKSNLASGYPNSTAHHVKQKIRQHFGVEE